MICPNCGLKGPHFAPPSLGEPGFFICWDAPTSKEKQRREEEEKKK